MIMLYYVIIYIIILFLVLINTYHLFITQYIDYSFVSFEVQWHSVYGTIMESIYSKNDS